MWVIDAIIDWKKVTDVLKELSKNDSKIEDLINEQVFEIIKKSYPDNYLDIIERKKDKLFEIKRRLKKLYSKKMKEEISIFCGHCN